MSASPDFDNPSLWDVRRGVVVFDEHSRPEKTLPSGKTIPARHFKKDDLEKISTNCNERDSMGLPCALVLGHTSDDETETNQPEIVGYERNFRVEYDDRLKKHVILADHYLRREKATEAEKYPRVSVEHWINQDFFDPVALVKRTPKLDLPQWHYGAKRPGQVVRYTMEAQPTDDPTSAPDAAAPNPELKEMVMKCIMECMKSPEVQKMMMPGGMGMAGPTNQAVPGAAPPPQQHAGAAPYTADGDVERFASEAEKIRYTRQQAEIEKLRKEADEIKAHYARAAAESTVKQLLYEGYDLDPEYEVQELMTRDQAGQEKYLKNVREHYQRAPVGGDMLRTFEPSPVERHQKPRDPNELTEAELDAALQHQRRTGEKDFDVALKYVREKKTA